jgi:hypothetical protein
MDINQQIENILTQINNELPPQELNGMLNTITREAGQQFHAPANPRTWREKLKALWEAIKAKINAWLCPVSSRWLQFLEAVKAKLQHLQSMPGNEKWAGIGLMAVGIVLVAVLVKSIPLLIGLLAALGFITLVRVADRFTRIPCCY